MSKTMDIICTECKEKYWCGQDYGRKTEKLYDENKLLRFLSKHKEHKLEYHVDSDYDFNDDYTDFEDTEKEKR